MTNSRQRNLEMYKLAKRFKKYISPLWVIIFWISVLIFTYLTIQSHYIWAYVIWEVIKNIFFSAIISISSQLIYTWLYTKNLSEEEKDLFIYHIKQKDEL